jgi:hypothetical protein
MDIEDEFSETIREFSELCDFLLTGIPNMSSAIDEILRPLYLETAAAYAAYRVGE